LTVYLENALLSCDGQRLDGDGIADGFETTDDAVLDLNALALVELGGSEVLMVEAVGEHAVDADE